MRSRKVHPEKEALHFIAAGKDKVIFDKRIINKEKGYGVIATNNIEPGEFLLEYVGRHITGSEGEALFKEYTDVDAAFLYFYSFQGQAFCVDGSKETARLGRFINDDHIKPNCEIKMILDEQESPHLCVFAIAKINTGEELVYDYGDPNCPWRHNTTASLCDGHADKRESRWKTSFENLDSMPGVMKIDEVNFNTKMKIANGRNAAEIFPGLLQERPVAVKRVPKHISKKELEMAYFLCSKNLQVEHLLQPISVLEDGYFAYFVSPLCEYSLGELIENKNLPERQSLTKQRRQEICQEFLLGLEELHSKGILHRDLKPENILFDINNKLYITDCGASEKKDLAQTTWPSYEDVGGPQYKYRKESDIQVAGCLVHYILTDGQHPYQTRTPYSSDPLGLAQNVKTGNFTLHCEEKWMSLKDIITRMLKSSFKERPTIEECLQVFTCFTQQSGYCGATTNSSSVNINEDRTHAAYCSTQTLDDMDILESIVSDQPEIGHLMDSSSSGQFSTTERVTRSLEMSDEEEQEQQAEEKTSSNTEEELSITEQQFSLYMEMTDEEHEQQGEEEIAEKEVIRGRPPSKTPMPMDQNTHDLQRNSIQVKTSSNSRHQRIYDKKNYCLYCQRPYAKITRHLKQKHQDKPEVAKALAHRQGPAMRNLLLSKIRNLGNYNHNCSVVKSGKGQIVPKRQATCQSTATDYLPCKFCFAMYVRTDLWRHLKRCKLQVKEDGPKNRRLQTSCSLMLPMDASISSGFKKVLEQMAYDTVTQVVKSDTLILLLGERMFAENGENVRQWSDIRNKMRELARLLVAAREIDRDIVFLKDLISPAKFNTVLEAVKKMTGFDDVTHQFSVPSTALKMRYSLVTVTSILQGQALHQQDNDLQTRAEQFQKLIELEWLKNVSSNATKTLEQKKWNKPQTLPLSKDIMRLQAHLNKQEELHKNNLIHHPTKTAWGELAQVTLTQLILFNRRCAGEVSRMEVKTYLQRNKGSMQDVIPDSLSQVERVTRVEIRGNRGRKVPVLFPNNVKTSVELLIKNREAVGISPSNPYIFARLNYGSCENIRGTDTMRRYAKECGARHPENISSTKLRKHVATVSQNLNLETLQTAKVSRLLALQSGLGEFKGKSRGDIIPNISSEEEDSDTDAEDVLPVQKATSSRKGNPAHGGFEDRAATSRKSRGEVKKSPSSQSRKSRRQWSKMERELAEHYFKGSLKEMKTPGKEECQRFLKEHPTLRDNGRDWKAVKYFVHNKITAIKRKLCQQY
ncbi:uncharacterized protein LOC115578126 isoform X2 [Sparus aurata]|uniref:uncharacterized protein LOC115578126 isoform X2 n=1 Tax=Sparus aurata TaxID=8175 RepID=UPI0011C0D44B|nr:uncharacterized protein LOC115578126 isoform X2 [Sparus aurata]